MKLILLAVFAILALEASAVEKKYTVRTSGRTLDEIVEQECNGNKDNLKNIAARNNLDKYATLKKRQVLYIECQKPKKSKKPAQQAQSAQQTQSAQAVPKNYKDYNGHFSTFPNNDENADNAKSLSECASACDKREYCYGIKFDTRCDLYDNALLLRVVPGEPTVYLRLKPDGTTFVFPHQID